MLPEAAAFSLALLPADMAARITVDPVTGEWAWSSRVGNDGYGRLGHELAHRAVWMALGFEIPDGLVLGRMPEWGCTSRACCSPWHWKPATSLACTMRGNSPHAVNARKDECDHGHPFTEANTYLRPDGSRECRVCCRARSREYRQARRETLRAAGATAGSLARAA